MVIIATCRHSMQVNVQPVYVTGLQGEAEASGSGDATSNNNIIQVLLTSVLDLNYMPHKLVCDLMRAQHCMSFF